MLVPHYILLMKRTPETPQVRTPSPFRSKALHLPQFSSTASRPDGSVKPVMRISLKPTNEIGETEVMRITDREKPSQIKGIFLAGIVLSLNIVSLAGQTNSYEAGANVLRPELKLARSLNLPGSFVSSQSIYADAERIFAASFQGDLFVLERDR